MSADIACLALPTPWAVGRVNCYLIDDDPLTLVDTGPNSGKALDALETGLAEHGRRVEDLERIVITHQHPDHEGLVEILRRRSGAEVCALDRLAPWLSGWRDEQKADDAFAAALMVRNGVPADIVAVLEALSQNFRAWGSSAPVDRILTDGGELGFAGRTLRVHHRPGHSPTDTVFHDAEQGLLIGGDHLIAHISSNPLASKDHDRPLVTYMESLRATRAMEGVETVLAGHGEPVTGVAELIDTRFALHERRARKIGGMVADRPLTAHEIASGLWGRASLTQAFLTLSEVLGHLDLLLERGEVTASEHEGVVRFAQASERSSSS